jgi:Uri superfamily endonuclease
MHLFCCCAASTNHATNEHGHHVDITSNRIIMPGSSALGSGKWKVDFFFNTKTARKWHIDRMESQDSPALRNKGVKVVHVKQRKSGRILF